ncbi:uncharacterized protein CLUP02_01144 [Colletotrichum lupini]|uniref:Uncharacterized protein n=1 Tax=Colletotrichum lupini TaxID=145971 RepID=A0A9Q8SCE6_9PEZI|nr:uncharacterized protein CLUP02_01144 [Colletotrichum lupini]UQC74493.1 hypothetical protein CLUP02_01144 [Colletotrichum lupini]
MDWRSYFDEGTEQKKNSSNSRKPSEGMNKWGRLSVLSTTRWERHVRQVVGTYAPDKAPYQRSSCSHRALMAFFLHLEGFHPPTGSTDAFRKPDVVALGDKLEDTEPVRGLMELAMRSWGGSHTSVAIIANCEPQCGNSPRDIWFLSMRLSLHEPPTHLPVPYLPSETRDTGKRYCFVCWFLGRNEALHSRAVLRQLDMMELGTYIFHAGKYLPPVERRILESVTMKISTCADMWISSNHHFPAGSRYDSPSSGEDLELGSKPLKTTKYPIYQQTIACKTAYKNIHHRELHTHAQRFMQQVDRSPVIPLVERLLVDQRLSSSKSPSKDDGPLWSLWSSLAANLTERPVELEAKDTSRDDDCRIATCSVGVQLVCFTNVAVVVVSSLHRRSDDSVRTRVRTAVRLRQGGKPSQATKRPDSLSTLDGAYAYMFQTFSILWAQAIVSIIFFSAAPFVGMVTGELSQSITSSLGSRVPESQYGYVGEGRLKRGGQRKVQLSVPAPRVRVELDRELRGTLNRAPCSGWRPLVASAVSGNWVLRRRRNQPSESSYIDRLFSTATSPAGAMHRAIANFLRQKDPRMPRRKVLKFITAEAVSLRQEAGRYGCSPPDSLSRNLPAVFHHFSWVTKVNTRLLGIWARPFAHQCRAPAYQDQVRTDNPNPADVASIVYRRRGPREGGDSQLLATYAFDETQTPFGGITDTPSSFSPRANQETVPGKQEGSSGPDEQGHMADAHKACWYEQYSVTHHMDTRYSAPLA